MGLYDEILKANRHDIKQAAQKSTTWFNQQQRLLAKQQVAPLRLVNSYNAPSTKRILPGAMYIFGYDAKTQDTLPYWDMFPVVFPIRPTDNGFIGLNIHYAPYKLRFVLLDALLENRTTKNLTENTRLRMDWGVISKASHSAIAKACIHRYLYSNIQTELKKVEVPDWSAVAMLPLQRFVGASIQQVWKDSIVKATR